MPEEIDKSVIWEIVKEYMQTGSFTDRKIADNPTEALSLVNRKYTNLNGSVAGRPNSSVATIGQKYFASDTKTLMTFDGINWYNGVASIVAQG